MGGRGEGGEVPLWHTNFLECPVASPARKTTTATAATADGTIAEIYLHVWGRLCGALLIPLILGHRCTSCTWNLNGL